MRYPNIEKIKKIKELKSKGLSQVEIAKQLNCSQTSISKTCIAHDIIWERVYRNQYGENNPFYKNGLGRSTIERLTRQIVQGAGRDLFICERCTYKSDNFELHRHHKDRNRNNNTNDNIEVLCVTCHSLEHKKDRARSDNGRYTT